MNGRVGTRREIPVRKTEGRGDEEEDEEEKA